MLPGGNTWRIGNRGRVFTITGSGAFSASQHCKGRVDRPKKAPDPFPLMLGLQTEGHGMISFTEYQLQSSTDKHGTVEINTEYITRKKPAWLVLLRLLGVAAMVAVGYGIALPSLAGVLPLWQSIVAVAGVMLIYVGLAFFFRPEPNTDNMGWMAGGMDDPTQYSDDINRSLWSLSCTLGPGRFVAESLLDTCVLAGLAHRDEIIDDQAAQINAEAGAEIPSVELLAVAPPTEQPAPLRPDRFEKPTPGPTGGQMQLDSWRYFQQS